MEFNGRNIPRVRQRGFTILEVMIAVAILTAVLAVVVESLVQLQQKNSTEVSRVDLTQESRQFMDQIVNDVHQTGFPNVRMYDPGAVTPASNIAQGLVNVSSTAIQFEADVDGSGVSEVYVQLVVPNGGCPCTIQRGTISKALALAGQTPFYYTEVNNVMNTNIFSVYDFAGNTLSLPTDPSELPNIKTVKMTLNVMSRFQDSDGSYPTITMSSEAKLNN